MANDNREPLRITAADLAEVVVREPGPNPIVAPRPGDAKSYGSITDAADKAPEVAEERGSFLLQGWFYLGAAGALGALAAWAMCEPSFLDGGGHRWGNIVMLPAIVTFMCVGFGLAEGLV